MLVRRSGIPAGFGTADSVVQRAEAADTSGNRQCLTIFNKN